MHEYKDKLIWMVILLIILAGYYINRWRKWKSYTGSTTGKIIRLNQGLRYYTADFEYYVNGKKYSGVANVSTIFGKPKAEVGMEIPVNYDKNNPYKYIVPEPFYRD